MPFWNPFRRNTELPEPRQVQVVNSTNEFFNYDAVAAAHLARGRWVVTGDGAVGILTGCRIDAMGEVTLVEVDGTTRTTVGLDDKGRPAFIPVVHLAELATLREARVSEIPLRGSEGSPEHLEYLKREHGHDSVEAFRMAIGYKP